MSYLGSDAGCFLKTVSELKVSLEKMWRNFPQNKAVPKRLGEYVKAGGIYFEHLL